MKTNSTTSLSLSESIRLGAMLGPKAIGVFYDERSGGTCAQGAALLANGALDRGYAPNNHIVMGQLWPWAKVPAGARCQHCEVRRESVASLIAHMNNEHEELSREAIADYVQTIEESLSSQEVPEVSDVREGVKV